MEAGIDGTFGVMLVDDEEAVRQAIASKVRMGKDRI